MLGAPTLVTMGLLFSFGSSSSGPPTPPSLPPAPGPPPAVSKQGVLDRQTVRNYIRLQQPAVRHCYERELGRRPRWRTTVTVELSIDATGRVTACSLGTSEIEQCVARAVCTIRFPYVFDALENGETRVSAVTTQVRYRFRFQPREKRQGDAGRGREPPSAGPAVPERTAKGPVTAGQTAPPPASSPTPVPAPAPTAPPAPSRPGKRVKVLKGTDPIEGLDQANPL